MNLSIATMQALSELGYHAKNESVETETRVTVFYVDSDDGHFEVHVSENDSIKVDKPGDTSDTPRLLVSVR